MRLRLCVVWPVSATSGQTNQQIERRYKAECGHSFFVSELFMASQAVIHLPRVQATVWILGTVARMLSEATHIADEWFQLRRSGAVDPMLT